MFSLNRNHVLSAGNSNSLTFFSTVLDKINIISMQHKKGVVKEQSLVEQHNNNISVYVRFYILLCTTKRLK